MTVSVVIHAQLEPFQQEELPNVLLVRLVNFHLLGNLNVQFPLWGIIQYQIKAMKLNVP